MDKDTALPGTGFVRVSVSLLREWLMLPEGFEVVNAEMDLGKQVKLTVRHKDVPITPDGTEIPTFIPIFQAKCDEDGVYWHRLKEISVTERS